MNPDVHRLGLGADSVQLSILILDLVAHVAGHALEVAQDTGHGLKVLFHLIFSGVVSNTFHYT